MGTPPNDEAFNQAFENFGNHIYPLNQHATILHIALQATINNDLAFEKVSDAY